MGRRPPELIGWLITVPLSISAAAPDLVADRHWSRLPVADSQVHDVHGMAVMTASSASIPAAAR